MSRSRPRRRWWQPAVVVVAGALTVALAHSTSGAVFTARTADTGNQVTASGNFCVSSGSTTLVASEDTTVYQGSPSTPYGSDPSVAVTSGAGGNARVLLRFALPSLGTGCSFTAAKLRMYVTSGQAGRPIDAYRIDPAATGWTEAGTTWNTWNSGPTVAGTAVSSGSIAAGAWQEWTVTPLMSGLVPTNSGFLVRDQVDNNSPTRTQYWDSRESATTAHWPQLLVSWG